MDNKIKEQIGFRLSFDSFNIQICKNPNLQPFLNVFHFKGENVDQENIGQIFGIIQVHDNSEPTKYLPNMVTQAIKKEFFRLPKRNAQLSIEAALHKANEALGDLVEEENINWIGKLDAVIGAFGQKNFSFTQTGKAKIFFIRNKKLLELTKGLDEKNENPIKTFSNVSSGPVEPEDKILFATRTIHDSLKIEDISRHINTFNSDEFDNLVKSTLETEGENVGVIIVNVNNEVVQKPKKLPRKSKLNYFGSDKDQNEDEEKNETLITELDKYKLSSELDQKIPTKEPEKESVPTTQEIASQDSKAEAFQIMPNSSEIETPDLNFSSQSKDLSPFEQQPELYINDEQSEDLEEEIEKSSSLSTKIAKKFSNINWKQIFHLKSDNLYKTSHNVKQKMIDAIKTKRPKSLQLDKSKNLGEQHKIENFWGQYKAGEKSFWRSLKQAVSHLFTSAKPRENTIGAAQEKITNHKKFIIISAVATLTLFVIVILLILKTKDPQSQNLLETTTKNEQTSKNDQIELTNNDKEFFEKIFAFEKEALQLCDDNGKLYVMTSEGSFYEFDIRNGSSKEIQIEDDNRKKFTKMVAMDDLNLIFFVSNDELISFNRVTENFAKHNIDFPENMELVEPETKGTYMYLTDKSSGQIFRYPRSEKNGFDTPKLWLSSTTDLSKALSIAIDDSIYIGYSDGKIEKYFKYKLEKSFLLESENKIIPFKISTMEDHPYYYVLDHENGILAKVAKLNNNLENIYQTSLLKNAKDILLESEGKNVYVLTEKTIYKLK